MTVLLDDACFKSSLPYPSIKSLSARSRVGGRHDPAAAASAGGAVQWGTGLRGRMGAVYLLDEYLKEEPLRALRARGPDPHAPPPAPSAPPNPDAPKKTRPIPEFADHPQMAPRNAPPDLDGDA